MKSTLDTLLFVILAEDIPLLCRPCNEVTACGPSGLIEIILPVVTHHNSQDIGLARGYLNHFSPPTRLLLFY